MVRPASPPPRSGQTRSPLWLEVGSWATHRFGALRRLNDAWLTARNRWLAPGIVRLEQAVGDADSLLEVGCGDSSPLAWFERKPAVTIGVDLFEPALRRSREAGIHTEYRRLDVLDIGEHFPPSSVDAVVAFDLIEHLTERDGLRLLDQMQRIARKRVVVFTPNSWLEQGEYGGNPWQAHRSGWTTTRMRELGYTVRGMSGLRWLRGEYATPRWRPQGFWKLVSAATQPLVYRRPRLAFHILCVRAMG